MSKLIKDTNDFKVASCLVSNMFYSEERLPNQVFKVPFQKTVVLDFDHAMSRRFWNELEKLIGLSGDTFVIMAVLDPHPVDYYYKEFSRYNWCVLQKGSTVDEYWGMLEQGPEESPADAISINSEVVVWISSSMKWAMWGERSYGICVLGFNDGELGDYESESWFTMDQAITDLVSLNFRNYTVPEEIVSKLMKHYSGSK
ncbi:diadenosine tetraphosphatase [Paenibacillus sp. JX-17]|uniref:Diadenosine tetraphosphatase n=1 Tax=Paenibacillus lacisoli TaxID=3064525 RepID=A0ABT9CLU6_9BACL|nr:diadenosine tetraphosphatase [Paenibacillus sp. JX-17]MDO7908892.1 diadenosine tetraphosphatase [Paenibacillus sp. JX-17]